MAARKDQFKNREALTRVRLASITARLRTPVTKPPAFTCKAEDGNLIADWVQLGPHPGDNGRTPWASRERRPQLRHT